MQMRGLSVGLLLAAALLTIPGCGTGGDDDDDDSPDANTNIRFDQFQVRCWAGDDGDYWRFDASVNDQDGPQDISEIYIEIRQANGFDVLSTFSFEAIENNSSCWYSEGSIESTVDCVECGQFGYKMIGYDETGNLAERTFGGETCSQEGSHYPEETLESPFSCTTP